MATIEQTLANIPLYKPSSYEGRFDRPVVVNPQIPPSLIFQALGVREQISSAKFTSVYPSDHPYLFWTHEGGKHPGQSVEEVISVLEKDEAVVSLAELTAIYLAHSDYFQRLALIAGEGDYAGFYPYISTFSRVPELFVVRANFRLARYEVLTRGKEIFP